MTDIALVTALGLHQLFMTTSQGSSGALVVCQQLPEYLLLQSGYPLRRHRFSPPTSLQCSLCQSQVSIRSHHRHAAPEDRSPSVCGCRRCAASILTETRGESHTDGPPGGFGPTPTPLCRSGPMAL